MKMNDRSDAHLDQTVSYHPQSYEDVPVEKRGNCLMIGCLGTLVFVLLLVVGGGFAGYKFIQGQVDKYTSDKPADLPVIEYSEEQLAAIENRVESFKESMDQGKAPESLVLTTDELNALISRENDLIGKVYVTIQEGKISGEISIPTDFITGGKDRYFNASATFNVSFDHGVLIVTLADAIVKGKRVPQAIIEGIGKENLARDMYKDPEVAEMLRRFESLIIEEDKIILKPRTTPDNVNEMEAESDGGVSHKDARSEETDGLPKVEGSHSENADSSLSEEAS
jgi:hypothetical protein